MNFIKKTILSLFLFSIFNISFAYTNEELKQKEKFYKPLIKQNLEGKLINFSSTRLNKALNNIEKFKQKYNGNSSFSDAQKLKIMAIINVVKIYVNNELSSRNALIITIINDKKCENCNSQSIIKNLKKDIPNAIFEYKDFGENGVSELLKSNGIRYLPAYIFSNNKNLIKVVSSNLKKTEIGNYSLYVKASKFNPFLKRSDRGFELLEKDDLEMLKSDDYIYGKKNTSITLLEYVNLQCPICREFRRSGNLETIRKKYSKDLNLIIKHFPFDNLKKSQKLAEILECYSKQKGKEGFYKLLNNNFDFEVQNEENLINEAIKLGGNKVKLDKCLVENKVKSKILKQRHNGIDLFLVKRTPTLVFINNKTGEYIVYSGFASVEKLSEIVEKIK